MTHTEPAILIENLTKRYGSGSTAVDALKGVDVKSTRTVIGIPGKVAE